MKILRAVLFCLAVSFAPVCLAVEDAQQQVQVIEAYLNSIQSMTADFTQMNQDGSLSRGKFYLQRPNQLRLQYAAPSRLILVTEGDYLAQHDKEAGEPLYIPLSSTPAGVLLGKRVRLSGEVTVTSVLPHPNGVSITVVRTQEPENGSISFLFRRQPTMQLERWIVYDAQGSITEVALSNVRTNEPINARMFSNQAALRN